MRVPKERRELFRLGFVGGVGRGVLKHPDDPDYLEGHRRGRQALRDFMAEVIDREGLPPYAIIRLVDSAEEAS